LEAYVRKEAAEQGSVSVRVGLPVVEGNRVAGEFWVTSTEASEPMTLVGGFIARLEPDGRCSHFREYWFYVEGEATPPTRAGATNAPSRRHLVGLLSESVLLIRCCPAGSLEFGSAARADISSTSPRPRCQ
jgi:hypothetical protein